MGECEKKIDYIVTFEPHEEYAREHLMLILNKCLKVD